MKRTLIVATTSYAGMGPYVSEIVNTFSPEDDVYFFFHDYEDDFFKRNIKKELHKKSVFFKQANSAINKLKELLLNSEGYDSLILDVCREFQIQMVHYINGLPSIKMQRCLEQNGINILSTVHDLSPHEAKKVWYKQFRQIVSYKRMKENLLAAKLLVTNSQNQYEELSRRFPEKKVYFHDFPSLVTSEIANGTKIPVELNHINKPYILFFGRIEEYKGIRLLFTAFCKSQELNNNYNLVIAGNGQLNIDTQKANSNVLFINRYIHDEEVAYMYKHAACVVYPYISATQSGVLSLAFYFKTPTLTSNVSFFRKIIEESQGGLMFENGDVDDLTEKIIALLHMDVSKMKQNQADYYRLNYNPQAIKNTLMDIYNNRK